MKGNSKSSLRDGSFKWVGLVIDTTITIILVEVARRCIKRLVGNGASNDGNMQQTKIELAKKTDRNLNSVSLNEYELLVAEDVVDKDALDTTFSMIGGLGSILEEIQDAILFPLMRPDVFKAIGGGSKLITHPKGVLFYGKPGTGKTMLARAIAKESGATLINLRQSTLQNKWFGESTKAVAALFSLAVKLSPTIIFIDEVDCFLGTRTSGDAHASLSMKTEFMTLWDGMLTNANEGGVMVLAATNRPEALDSAIQRRLTRSFEVPLPDSIGRYEIMKLLLKDERLANDVNLKFIANNLTKGYSGSDLHSLCSTAVLCRMKESVRQIRQDTFNIDSKTCQQCLTMKDFSLALERIKRTGASAQEYISKTQIEESGSGGFPNLLNNNSQTYGSLKEFLIAVLSS